MDDEKDHIKIVFLGECDVGKTSLINRYITNSFDENVPHSTCASYASRKIEYDNKYYTLDIWDTSGIETLRSLTKFFVRDAKVIVLVYDITRKRTLLELDYWLDLILKELGSNIFLILVANKSDLYLNEEIREKDGIKFAETLNAKFILCSAKEISNWSDSFEKAIIDYIKTLNQ